MDEEQISGLIWAIMDKIKKAEKGILSAFCVPCFKPFAFSLVKKNYAFAFFSLIFFSKFLLGLSSR